MRLLRVFRKRARSLFRGARVDRELASELAYHLEALTRENVAAGMDPGEARAAARRALGGTAAIAEECRDQRRLGWLTDLRKDIAYAWRMLRKSPRFTAIAAVTLALGVGASIAVYALAESLFLRSLPYPHAERLTAIYSVHAKRGENESVGQEDFRDWQAANTVFERMAFLEFDQMTLIGRGDAERITGMSVSEGFFEMLGVAPELGRWFTPEEQKPGAARVVMLSHGFWMRKMGARPDAAGSTIFLSGFPYRVTGVMPESFRFNTWFAGEYWTPITYVNYGHRNHQYAAYGRLKPGVSIRAAQAQMSQIARRMEKQFPDCAGWGVRVVGLRSDFMQEFNPALRIFAAAALIVLLVSCANVASLLLARGVGRSKEIAVRMALGAGRRRLIRLLLTESLLLACLGTLAGLALAAWLIRLAITAAPARLDLGAIVEVSPTLVGFTVAVMLFTGLLTGVWPALRGLRGDLQSELKESGNSLVAGRQQARALNGLVVMEIALAVMLLTFAGLLTKSFARLLHTDLGYRTDHLLTFRMALPESRYKTGEARVRFWDNLQAQLAGLPGVVSAAAADGVPLGGTYSSTAIEIDGHAAPRDWTDISSRVSGVSADYFRTMGIAFEAGRGFDTGDTAASEPVAIVNRNFVRNLLRGENPIGSRMRFNRGKWRRIVGVIGDAHYNGPQQGVEAEVYLPLPQTGWFEFVALRTKSPADAVFGAVRGIIRRMDPRLPVSEVRTMKQSIDMATSLEREMMALVVGFALVTLAMATLALGGVMAYTVSRRRREIGLRMALGASGRDVSRVVIGNAARLILAGCASGVVCAFAGARVLASLLYGVRPHDPAMLAMAPALLAAIALAACAGPAHKAATVDPMEALRQE